LKSFLLISFQNESKNATFRMSPRPLFAGRIESQVLSQAWQRPARAAAAPPPPHRRRLASNGYFVEPALFAIGYMFLFAGESGDAKKK